MIEVDPSEFGRIGGAIAEAWCRETSASPEEWSEENPALGQCAVTALVVQDLLGGRLVRDTVGGQSHYFNLVLGGALGLDLTMVQFGEGAQYDGAPEERDREYVLSFPHTAARYELMRRRLVEALG